MLNAMFASALPTDTASGSIASFPDGTDILPAISVRDSIEPIQDLNGYDKPWSGENGANKFDEITELGAIGSNGVPYATNDSIRSKNFCPCVGGAVYFVKGTEAVYWYDANKAFISVDYANNNTKTAPSNAEYFRLGFYASYGTTYNHDIAINYPSTVTTYSPYSNICPISGRTEVVTSRVGKNLFDESIFGTLSGWTETDGTYTGNSSQFVNSFVVLSDVPAETQVTISFEGIVNGSTLRAGYVWIDYTDGTHSYLAFIGNTWNSYSLTSTATKSVAQIRFADSNSLSISIRKAQIELGTTATAYEPYTAETYTTALGQTVYGGTLDVVSGVLTVDRAMVDLGSLAWTLDRGGFFQAMFADDIKHYASSETANAICSSYAVASVLYAGTNNGYFGIYYYASGAKNYIRIRGEAYADATSFTTAVSGQTVCYELATPTTIQLTPQEVELLKGTNNLWCDSGNIEVNYYADIQKWIERKTN